MATTGDETLADERRRRIPAAVASLAAGILTLVGGGLAAYVYSGRPTVPVLGALREHLEATGSEPGLKARQVLWYDDNAVELLLVAFVLALAATAIGFALLHLHRSTKARNPELRQGIYYAAVGGPALVVLSGLLQGVGVVVAAGGFADSSMQTGAAADDVFRTPLLTAAQVLTAFGVITVAFAFILLALNAMRVGLLTRFMGVLGIIVGALFIIPLGSSLPLVQAFWLIGLGLLFLGRWPSGMPPAWVTGESQPWPTQQELRERRLEGQAARQADDRPRRGVRRERAEPPETPAPELPARKPHPSSKKKRKRKRR